MLTIYDWSSLHSSFPSSGEESSSGLCQHRTSPSLLPTTDFGEGQSACVGLALGAAIPGAFGTEISPSTPNTSAQKGICHCQQVSLYKGKVNKAVGREEGGATNVSLWFPFVGKHDGSEQGCWKAPHLSQDRQTDTHTGGILH